MSGAVSWRRAGPADAVLLTELEQAAGLGALGHVFPAEDFPYPTEAVLARWRSTLADPRTGTDLAEDDAGPVALVCWDEAVLRHLAVRPDRWRGGVGRVAVGRAVAAVRARGTAQPRLWCLAENVRALGFYGRLGWERTGQQRRAVWPPYPTEVELVLRG